MIMIIMYNMYNILYLHVSEKWGLCSVSDDPTLPLARSVLLDGDRRNPGHGVPIAGPGVRLSHLQIHAQVQPVSVG